MEKVFNSLLDFSKTNNITNDVCTLIESAQKAAYKSVDVFLVQRNWLIGYRIAEEEIKDSSRSQLYGKEIIKDLSKNLIAIYGKGFDSTNLYKFRQFYELFPNILDTMRLKSFSELLTWSHYRVLLQVKDKTARLWYAQESYAETWSVRTLQRNVSSQYYYRMLQSPKPEAVKTEMQSLVKAYQNNKLEFIKNPVITEFLGFAQNIDFTESDLEKSILSNIQKFLMELGKGFAFVARQQHIHTEKRTACRN